MQGTDLRYERDGVTMAYTEYGTGDSAAGGDGRPRVFVLVHGIGMGRITFAGVAEKLSLRGRAIACAHAIGSRRSPERSPGR